MTETIFRFCFICKISIFFSGKKTFLNIHSEYPPFADKGSTSSDECRLLSRCAKLLLGEGEAETKTRCYISISHFHNGMTEMIFPFSSKVSSSSLVTICKCCTF